MRANKVSCTKEYFLSKIIKKEQKNILKANSTFALTNTHYNNILKKFRTLVEELNLQNSLEISILYTYLMWNGYFSKDKKFNYSLERRALIPGKYSYDIMNGNGVCLNFSDMLNDILNECGYSSSTIINRNINFKDIKSYYIPNIKRKIIKPKLYTKAVNIVFSPITRISGDHAFNLINENGKLYIYDSTNLVLLKVNDTNSANIIAGSGRFELKPLFSYFVNKEYTRKNLDDLYNKNFILCPYTRSNYIITSEICVDLFKMNKNLFNDYYDDIKDDILYISKTVDYYKKSKIKI